MCRLSPDTRIFVVEDEVIAASYLRIQLGKLGFRSVEILDSGEAAVAEAGRGAPALLLMDINLSGPMDGIEAAALIRKACGTRLVFITGYSDKALVARARALDPEGYLLKPLDANQLRAVLDSLGRSEQA